LFVGGLNDLADPFDERDQTLEGDRTLDLQDLVRTGSSSRKPRVRR